MSIISVPANPPALLVCADVNQTGNSGAQPSSDSPLEADPLQSGRLLIVLVSIGIAAYLLTSGVIQLSFAALCIGICGVTFGSDDPSSIVTWLAASCVMTSLMRFMLSICIARPSYNRSVWPKPSEHASYDEQLDALAFLPDLHSRSRDMSVLNRAQLAAGIIHPAFYYRTLLVAWHEGLISSLWLVLHIMRLSQLSVRFNDDLYHQLIKRDQYLDEIYVSFGSNYTHAPLRVATQNLQLKETDVINHFKTATIMVKLASHTCELMSHKAAQIFYLEDMGQICLLLISMLLLPMLSRMVRFFYHR